MPEDPGTVTPFELWLVEGVEKGFCSKVFCMTHDGAPYDEIEEALIEDGHDPCVPAVRLYPEGAKDVDTSAS